MDALTLVVDSVGSSELKPVSEAEVGQLNLHDQSGDADFG
jgi:hypothetical protein